MFNRSAGLSMSTSVLKALPGKLDIKRHSPIILFLSTALAIDVFFILIALLFLISSYNIGCMYS